MKPRLKPIDKKMILFALGVIFWLFFSMVLIRFISLALFNGETSLVVGTGLLSSFFITLIWMGILAVGLIPMIIIARRHGL